MGIREFYFSHDLKGVFLYVNGECRQFSRWLHHMIHTCNYWKYLRKWNMFTIIGYMYENSTYKQKYSSIYFCMIWKIEIDSYVCYKSGVTVTRAFFSFWWKSKLLLKRRQLKRFVYFCWHQCWLCVLAKWNC